MAMLTCVRHCSVCDYHAMRGDAMRCDAMRCDAMRCDAMRCGVMQCNAGMGIVWYR